MKFVYNTSHSVVETQFAESRVACQTPTVVRAAHSSAFTSEGKTPAAP